MYDGSFVKKTVDSDAYINPSKITTPMNNNYDVGNRNILYVLRDSIKIQIIVVASQRDIGLAWDFTISMKILHVFTLFYLAGRMVKNFTL